MNVNVEQHDGTEELTRLPADRCLWRWLPLVLRNARSIVRFVIAVTVAAAALSFVLPVRYESEARLLPSDSDAESGKLLKMLGGMADAAIMAGYTGDAGGTADAGRFIGILRSRTVADRIIDQFDLMKVYGTTKREIARLSCSGTRSSPRNAKRGKSCSALPITTPGAPPTLREPI